MKETQKEMINNVLYVFESRAEAKAEVYVNAEWIRLIDV